MIAQFLYRNPRILLLAIGVIVVAGLSSYHLLPRLEDPVLGRRVAVISSVFPGADAERVESLVTIPLEEQLRGIAQIKEIRSNSRSGISNIVLKLRDDVDEFDPAWSSVRDRLVDAEELLPNGCRRPSFDIFPLKAFAAVVAIKWHGPTDADFSIMRKLSRQLLQQISHLSGTESVEMFGDTGEQYTAEVEPTVLASMQLSTGAIANQVAANTANHPAGIARTDEAQLLLDVVSADSNIGKLRNANIRFGSRGEAVKLGEIATIRKSPVKPITDAALIDGERAIVIGAFFDDRLRVDRWAAGLESLVEKFQARYASEIDVEIIFSQKDYINARLDHLLWNLTLGATAVVAVVFILMGWRSMVVVGLTLPLSSLLVLIGLRVLEIPMHQMSITGLIIALGLLIDNAIVIVEDVRSRIYVGASSLSAIGDSIRHLGMPLFGSTVTTALAFMPIATLPGPPGEFVGAIAISVILAIASSFLLAMTLVPALLSLMRVNAKQHSLFNYGVSNQLLERVYRLSLGVVFRVPLFGVVLAAALPVVGFLAIPALSEQFFPPSDRDQIQIEVELSAREPSTNTLRAVRQIAGSVESTPGVERAHWFVGRSAPTFYYNVVPSRRGTPFYAQAIVELSDVSDASSLIQTLQANLDAEFADCRCIVRQLEQGPPFDAPIELRVSGSDLATLQKLGSELRLLLSQTPDVIHTRSDSQDAVPKLVLKVDKQQSSESRHTTSELTRLLYTSLEGAPAGTLLDGEEELPVLVRMANQGPHRLDRLAALQIAPPRQQAEQLARQTPPKLPVATPLSAVGSFELGADLAAVVRINGRRTNEIKAYLNAGVLPATVLDTFKVKLADSDFQLPEGYHLSFAGEGAERADAIERLVANAGVLFALIVLTLVVSFRSFRSATIILVVGGLTIGLGPLSLWLFGYPLGFMAIVGTMGLVGVAINDSIVVLAAIREDEAARRGDAAAIATVVFGCTRHILATTVTTIAGFLPLILSGGGFWPPLAITIAAGVSGATLMALYLVPSLYLLLHRRQTASA